MSEGLLLDLLETISGFATKIAESKGLELVDAELFRAGKRRVLRIYIGKLGGVSVTDCADVSRELSALLDAENTMGEEAFVLEVSSPGLDRPFKTLKDYARNIDKDVRISCKEAVLGKFLWVGKIKNISEEEITLEVEGSEKTIPVGKIAQAKVDIRF